MIDNLICMTIKSFSLSYILPLYSQFRVIVISKKNVTITGDFIYERIDFDNGKITTNIFQAAIPMLILILSLLYNIVDRIYIARIPDIGTTALGAVGLCFQIGDYYGF